MNSQSHIALKRITWMGGLIAGAVLILSAVEHKRASRIAEMQITIEPLNVNEYLLTEQDVRATISSSFGMQMEGQQLASLDVDKIEKSLEKEPFILNAEVFVDARNKIFVDITQREPVLRVIDAKGVNYYLDKSGKRLPLSSYHSPRTLVATGNIPVFIDDFKLRKNHLLKDLFELTLQITEDELLSRLIEQVHVTVRGEYILIPKIGRQKIDFGKYEDADHKLRRLKVFYLEGMPYLGWRNYQRINLKFKNQVVAGT